MTCFLHVSVVRMQLVAIHIRVHTRWLQLASNRGYRRLRRAMIQGCLGLPRAPRRVGPRRDSHSPLRWYSRGRGARRGGSMMLVDASSHYSLRFRLVVFHLWWSWTELLPLSASNRRVQIFPGGICLVSADRRQAKCNGPLLEFSKVPVCRGQP